MKDRKLFTVAATGILAFSSLLSAQEKGQWRAASTTAKSITGDLAFTDIKLILNFNAFTIAQIRSLTPAEATALFHADPSGVGGGSLYRTDIPSDKRFLHKNTLCGSEDAQWVATYVVGKSLQLALFSGNDIPALTADSLANATNLCGTYTYVR